MAKYKTLKRKYTALHRYMCGITVSCFIVTVVGSTLAGGTMVGVMIAGATVIFGLALCQYLIIKVWASWEEVQDETQKMRARPTR